jgi:hypothetical protein
MSSILESGYSMLDTTMVDGSRRKTVARRHVRSQPELGGRSDAREFEEGIDGAKLDAYRGTMRLDDLERYLSESLLRTSTRPPPSLSITSTSTAGRGYGSWCSRMSSTAPGISKSYDI